MKSLKLSVSLVFLVLFQLGLSAQEPEAEKPAIIPQPAEIEWKEDFFTLQERTVVCFNSGAEAPAAWLQRLLKNTYTQSYTMKGENCNGFSLNLDPNLEETLGKEGYNLDISSSVVSLEAASEAGLFYGIQTLRQMFPAEIENEKVSEEIKLPQVAITDSPKYEWRGSMLDIARSFFGPDYIKKHLDRMAFYKLNRLHLHLTDDQGWRIEIKQKPKLTELGSKGAVKGGRAGYLTQEEYKEIQEYAAARNIVIVPEIDMPGHIYSALMAYPELNCEEFANIEPRLATPPQLFHEYTVGWSKLCLDKPEIYDFVATVLGEMAEITTGDYLHIGGDEIEDERYKEFVVKADSIVRGLGKVSIGWEEVTQAQVDSTLISQRWTGKTKSIVNTRVIESICSSFYFDHANIPGQEFTNNWCQERGVSLKDTYNFKSKNPNTIGVEAPVWTEMVLSNEAADDRFWPRTIAMAEVGWSEDENKDYKNFINRLGEHGLRLDLLDVHYFRTPEVDWNSDRNKGVFQNLCPNPDGKFLTELKMENNNPDTEKTSNYNDLEKMSTATLLSNINKEDKTVPESVEKQIPAIEMLVEEIVSKMELGGRLFYIGAGTSGRLGVLDASECPPTFGVSDQMVIGLIAGGDTALRNAVENAEDDTEQAWKDLQQYQISEKDVLVGIAASGTTPYVIGGIKEARKKGIITGCVTCSSGSPLAEASEFPVEVVTGPEFVTGSTRMKAGTAQKLVLNMISTSVMIKLGRVKGNKMVDMQLSNKKLVGRGIRMIMEELGIEENEAARLLQEYGSVREAVLAYRKT